MELVEYHLGVTARFPHSLLVGLAHVHTHLGYPMPMAIVFFQCGNETQPHLMIPALSGTEHPLAHQIGEHAHILPSLAHTHLIDTNATDLTKIGLCISRLHLPEEH